MNLSSSLSLRSPMLGRGPAPLAAPVLSNVAIIPSLGATGMTFTAAYGVSGNPAPTVTFGWKMDNVTISGATGPSVTINTGDLAGVLELTINATNSQGSAAPQTATAVVEFRIGVLDNGNIIVYTTASGPSLTFASGDSKITISGPAGTHDVFWQLSSANPETDYWTRVTVTLPGGEITGLTNGLSYRVQGTSGSDRTVITPAQAVAPLTHVGAIDEWDGDPVALSNAAGVNVLLIANNGTNTNIPATPSGFTSVATDSGNSAGINVCLRKNCPANLDVAAITDASTVVAWAFSGDTDIGAIAIVKGSGTTLSDPAITLEGNNDNSAVLAHAFIRNSTPLPARGSPAGANARATKDTGFSRHRLEQWFNIARPTFPSATRTTLAATSSGHFLVGVQLEQTLTPPAPTTSGSISTQRVQENTGTVTIATASAFAGTITNFSIVSSFINGMSINASTGAISINSAIIGRRYNQSVTVRASNAAGYADQTFTLTVCPQVWFSIPYAQLDPLSGAQRSAWFASARAKNAWGVRIDFEPEWAWFGPTPPGGTFYTIPDDFVTRANAEGLQVMFILKGPPQWAQPGGGNATSYPSAAQRAAFATRVTEVATRYNGVSNPSMKVSVWELWNEPNLPGFSQSPNAADYATFVNAMAPAVAAGNPSAEILIGALSPAEDSATPPILGAPEFTTAMYAAGVSGHTGFSFHPYSSPELPSGTSAWNGWHMMETVIKPILDANGDSNKKVWVTEVGRPVGGNTGIAAGTEAQQRDNILEALDIGAQTQWIGPICIYSLRHKGIGAPIGTGSTEDWFGVERNDGTNPTLAATALATVLRGA